MPGFYEKMKDRLRSPAEGADTALWLAVSPSVGVGKNESGLFYQDRKPVAEHLALARTRTSEEDEDKLMAKLEEYSNKFSSS